MHCHIRVTPIARAQGFARSEDGSITIFACFMVFCILMFCV